MHAGSELQSSSSQSVPLSQSLSTPSLQLVSVEGGVPQSAGQLHWSSPESQVPSPQKLEPDTSVSTYVAPVLPGSSQSLRRDEDDPPPVQDTENLPYQSELSLPQAA